MAALSHVPSNAPRLFPRKKTNLAFEPDYKIRVLCIILYVKIFTSNPRVSKMQCESAFLFVLGFSFSVFRVAISLEADCGGGNW